MSASRTRSLTNRSHAANSSPSPGGATPSRAQRSGSRVLADHSDLGEQLVPMDQALSVDEDLLAALLTEVDGQPARPPLLARRAGPATRPQPARPSRHPSDSCRRHGRSRLWSRPTGLAARRRPLGDIDVGECSHHPYFKSALSSIDMSVGRRRFRSRSGARCALNSTDVSAAVAARRADFRRRTALW